MVFRIETGSPRLVENQQEYAQHWDGHRVPLMKRAEVPRGWVVDGSLTEDFWNKVHRNQIVLPIRPSDGKSRAEKKARRTLSEWQEKYGEVVVVTFLDEEAESIWVTGPVLVADLSKSPEAVLEESLEVGQGDLFLAEMKHRAYKILAGWQD
jgi:hypothetical protein